MQSVEEILLNAVWDIVFNRCRKTSYIDCCEGVGRVNHIRDAGRDASKVEIRSDDSKTLLCKKCCLYEYTLVLFGPLHNRTVYVTSRQAVCFLPADRSRGLGNRENYLLGYETFIAKAKERHAHELYCP